MIEIPLGRVYEFDWNFCGSSYYTSSDTDNEYYSIVISTGTYFFKGYPANRVNSLK
jgi:hypothetical protein